MPNEMLKAELRGGWLGLPQQYTAFDFLGVALGGYFVYSAVGARKPPAWLTASLGVLMIYIHSQRFMHAPQTKAGLRRLMQQLDVTPEELMRF